MNRRYELLCSWPAEEIIIVKYCWGTCRLGPSHGITTSIGLVNSKSSHHGYCKICSYWNSKGHSCIPLLRSASDTPLFFQLIQLLTRHSSNYRCRTVWKRIWCRRLRRQHPEESYWIRSFSSSPLNIGGLCMVDGVPDEDSYINLLTDAWQPTVQ